MSEQVLEHQAETPCWIEKHNSRSGWRLCLTRQWSSFLSQPGHVQRKRSMDAIPTRFLRARWI